MKLIIAGTRSYKDYDQLSIICDSIIDGQTEVEIVSGRARGADKLGEDYAKEKGYPIKPFPAAWDDIEGKPTHEIGYTKSGKPYWKKAGYVRNAQMAEYADRLVVFWDGKSNGTKNMIENARKQLLIIDIIEYV